MGKTLLIVESPAKAKTIKKYLGTGYEVLASKGHIKDLPKSPSAVDVANDFTERAAANLIDRAVYIDAVLPEESR